MKALRSLPTAAEYYHAHTVLYVTFQTQRAIPRHLSRVNLAKLFISLYANTASFSRDVLTKLWTSGTGGCHSQQAAACMLQQNYSHVHCHIIYDMLLLSSATSVCQHQIILHVAILPEKNTRYNVRNKLMRKKKSHIYPCLMALTPSLTSALLNCVIYLYMSW